jgi:hypothetical protein
MDRSEWIRREVTVLCAVPLCSFHADTEAMESGPHYASFSCCVFPLRGLAILLT